MPRNAYTQVRRLSTHPAFSLGDGFLHCPLCAAAPFAQVAAYEQHLLAHPELTAEIAWRFLSATRWARERGRRGWPKTTAMLEADRRRELAVHPAFRSMDARLACPLCPAVEERRAAFEAHLLGHPELDAATAARYLRPDRYARERANPSWRNGVRFEARRAWPEQEQQQ